jgi:proteasome lid subunit RPN8/RPN11
VDPGAYGSHARPDHYVEHLGSGPRGGGWWAVWLIMHLSLCRSDYEALIAEAQAGYPLEICGLAAGRLREILRLYPVPNRLASASAYEMEPRQQIEAMIDLENRGWELVAAYHSHPRGPDTPSPTDMAQAYYPGLIQIIISLDERRRPVVRAFLIDGPRPEEVTLDVTEMAGAQ